ncbi:MAG TPA: hypothetical protein VGN69_05505 [Solirubrobacteraceae bacterium]|nr:hypothetical protein [Solirubrobacteraceae bacterium]
MAALLESRGLRDVDAREKFGQPNIFALAAELLPACRRGAERRGLPVAALDSGPPGDEEIVITRPLRAYIRGGFFFVPLGLQLACLLVFGESLWASLHFTTAQASVVAGSVGLSFTVTAGFIQALGYLGPMFAGAEKYILERRITYRLTGVAVLAVVVVGALVYGGNELFGVFPRNLVQVGLVYYALQCGLLLSNAVLYMLRRYSLILLTTICGLAAVQLTRTLAGTGLYVSHWLGVTVAIIVSLALSDLVLRRRARTTEGDLRLATLPERSTLVRYSAPTFIYGVLYFSFLFADRLVAWSAGHHPLAVWFSSNYELGLDWALISVVGAMAYLEVIVNAISLRLLTAQRDYRGGETQRHNTDLRSFYMRQMGRMLVLIIVLGVVVHVVVGLITEIPGSGDVTRYLSQSDTQSVHLWAVVGYGLIALALANIVILTSLALRWPITYALGAAIVVGVPLSIILSRTGPFWWSVIGMVAGALVMFLVSTVYTWRALERADYHSFARY